MSAPAGWHLQPDGRERYWDGTKWTDQFRAPLPVDPTAPPPPPSWAPSVDETQALDTSSTQAIPSLPDQQPHQPGDQQPYQPAYPQTAYPQTGYPQSAYQQPTQPGYPQAGYPQTNYQQPTQPGYPQTGYGAPGNQQYAPPPNQGSGLAKGCLIAAIIGILVVAMGIFGAIFVFNRTVDKVSDGISSAFPSGLPSDFPSDLPTEGLDDSIELSVGDGFDLPRATVDSGWSLEADDSGIGVVNIKGMRATVGDDDGFPVLFTMSFPAADGGTVETVCTAPSGSAGATVDVSCVPLFGDVADATEVTVTASL